eukprot:50105_1
MKITFVRTGDSFNTRLSIIIVGNMLIWIILLTLWDCMQWIIWVIMNINKQGSITLVKEHSNTVEEVELSDNDSGYMEYGSSVLWYEREILKWNKSIPTPSLRR